MPDGSRSERNHTVVSWLALAILAYLLFLVLEPLLVPIGWAAVIAIVFYPLQARLARRWNPAGAATLTTTTVAVLVIAPVFGLAAVFVNEAVDAARGLEEGFNNGSLDWIDRASDAILLRLPVAGGFDLRSAALDAMQQGTLTLAGYSGAILKNALTFVVDLVLALFMSFFLLRDGQSILATIRRILPLEEADRDRLIAQTADLISVSVRSSVIVAALQGLLGGLVFALVGIGAPVFWGVVMGWLCLLPLGAWLVWLPAAIILAAQGAVGKALIVGGLGFGIVSSVDNFLRPMLMAERTSMNGLLVFVSLLGGVAAFGALGLVLGPVVMATAAALVTTYRAGR